MPNFSLYDRFTINGTLTEEDGVPDPRYALPSTVNWMRALAILVKEEGIDYSKAWDFYSSVKKHRHTEKQENSIFEQLLLGLHQLAALRSMASIDKQADIVRVASVGWYYGIYETATAMVTVQDGSIQDNHTKTANTWDQQLVQRKQVLYPFDLRVSTLVPGAAKKEINAIRRAPPANLIRTPTNIDEAHQAVCGYLSGNVEWWSWRAKEDLKKSKEFKNLGVSDFRTKKAQSLRDDRLRKQSISFLHQAIRYRGKANYREALYFAHGRSVEGTIAGFVSDMADVLEAFLAMAGAFTHRRLGEELMKGFILDIAKNRSFTLDPNSVWS
jgi:hypothetical protein